MAKVGRPTKFKPEYVEQARKLAILGATTPDLADFFDVATSTIEKWQKEIPEFSGALKAGKDEVDAQVTKSLFKRATGWEHKAVKIFADAKTGAEQIVPYIERYPPDTTAAIFWLKNRRPDLWRDMQQREHTGPDGGPIQVEEVVVVRNRITNRISGIASRISGQPTGAGVASVPGHTNGDRASGR